LTLEAAEVADGGGEPLGLDEDARDADDPAAVGGARRAANAGGFVGEELEGSHGPRQRLPSSAAKTSAVTVERSRATSP
jgi:hypothetical protein